MGLKRITRELIRKRSEHNEGVITTLEELSLHQEELLGIDEILGTTCRKLKILYLQNNVIDKMQHLHHLKELEYLNLALNNIEKIEGLEKCEFLNKLDLTVNFVDLDVCEESISNLVPRHNLRELFMLGNPCASDWDGFQNYAIARLPQLEYLDGLEITRSKRILAQQQLPHLQLQLKGLAAARRAKRAAERAAKNPSADADAKTDSAEELPEGEWMVPVDDDEPRARVVDADEEAFWLGEDDDRPALDGVADVEGGLGGDGAPGGAGAGSALVARKPGERVNWTGNQDDEKTGHTPEVRREIYEELADQKQEQEDRKKHMEPKKRDYDAEQKEAIAAARQREDEGRIQQCNQGKWDFRFDEEERPGHVLLRVPVQRHLDSSLIDVDVHPTYCSVVIKSKVLRLNLPAEVRSAEAKCERSKLTGELLVVMPKQDASENARGLRVAAQRREKDEAAKRAEIAARVTARDDAKLGRQAILAAQEARQAANAANKAAGIAAAAPPPKPAGAVSLKGLVPKHKGGLGRDVEEEAANAFTVVKETRTAMPPPPPGADAGGEDDDDDDDEPPPPM